MALMSDMNSINSVKVFLRLAVGGHMRHTEGGVIHACK